MNKSFARRAIIAALLSVMLAASFSAPAYAVSYKPASGKLVEAMSGAGINMDYPIRCFYRCRRTGSYTGMYHCGTVNAESLKAAVKKVNYEYAKKGRKPPFKIIRLKKKQFKNYKKYLKRGNIVCTGKHTAILM